MVLSPFYKINGAAMVAPDENVEMSFEDLDSGESGRDESGFMHRIVVRQKVGVWNFCYSRLSAGEYAYMMEILPKGGSFTFTYPTGADGTGEAVCQAYLSGYSIAWRSARTKDYRNLKFSIIQC